MPERIWSIIRNNDMCVLATTDGCKPHTSLMTYFTHAAEQTPRTIYMITSIASRKYANIQANPHVSLLVDTRLDNASAPHAGTMALTITGEATLTPVEAEERIVLTLLCKNPHLEPFVQAQPSALISVRIQSLQLLDGLLDMREIQI